MPMQPYFFSEGFLPRYGDSKWRRWMKILGEIQSQPGSDPANDCNRTDPIRRIKYKILRALNNVASPNLITGNYGAIPPARITVSGLTIGATYYFDPVDDEVAGIPAFITYNASGGPPAITLSDGTFGTFEASATTVYVSNTNALGETPTAVLRHL